MSENELYEMFNKAKSDLQYKSEIDHAFVQGKIEGWAEAINYFVAKIQEADKETHKPTKDKDNK